MHRVSFKTGAARMIGAAGLAMAGAPAALAQGQLDHPVGEYFQMTRDTGAIDNPGGERSVWGEVLTVEGSGWMRVYFDDAALPPGSVVRVTGLLDGQTQELDAHALAMWGRTSAYFNGESVMVELVAGEGTRGNRLRVARVAGQLGDAGTRVCGICGADDRTPSTEAPFGRLMPSGCSSTIYCEDGGLISAGHCAGGQQVVEYNVPLSNSNCSLNHPPVEDQFPVVQQQWSNNGVGNDWAVMTTGVNNLGQTIYERYGEIVPVSPAPAAAGDVSRVVGYGIDDECVRNQAQQDSPGNILTRGNNQYTFTNDVRGGNSGSGLVVGGMLVGVVTHCSNSCPGTGGNFGTRADRAEFAAARLALSTCEKPNHDLIIETDPFFFVAMGVSPPDIYGQGDGFAFNTWTYQEGTVVTFTAPDPASEGWCFDEWRVNGASVSVEPTLMLSIDGDSTAVAVYTEAACDDCPADFNGDGTVNTLDVLSFLNAWSAQQSEADFNGDGTVNTLDVLAFLNAWSAGC